MRLANLEISDRSLIQLARCASLRELIINCCFLITDVGLLALTHLTGLKSLGITQCPKITLYGLKLFQTTLHVWKLV